MSWFKRSPRKNEPAKRYIPTPHRISPTSEQMMDKAKTLGPNKSEKNESNPDK